MQATTHGVKVGGRKRAPTPEDLIELLRPELQQVFKPAFLGRLNVVPYYPVQDAVLRQIVRLKLDKLAARMTANHGAKLSFDNRVVDLIAGRCTEVDSGARNADAIIANTLMSDLSGRILERMAANQPVRTARIKVNKGELRTQLS